MIEAGRRVFEIEIESLRAVCDGLGASFTAAANAIMECRGKVIVTGLGKSGAIGRKIAATFSSTGTPAAFLHATESVHGDLGIIDRNDLVIAISYSGEQNELAQIIPAIKRLEVRLIAITGNPSSTLGKAAEIVLPVSVPKEACPLGLAPTSSTTATLVMGDALAVAVYDARGFTVEDFAIRHPGGALGRSLLRVSDLMHTRHEMPCVSESATMGDAILEMTRKKMGMTCVVDAAGFLTGIVTDGDLRRLVQREPRLLERTVGECMTRGPKTVDADILAVLALTLMEDRKITALVAVDADGRPMGVIHIHDILRSKVV